MAAAKSSESRTVEIVVSLPVKLTFTCSAAQRRKIINDLAFMEINPLRLKGPGFRVKIEAP